MARALGLGAEELREQIREAVMGVMVKEAIRELKKIFWRPGKSRVKDGRLVNRRPL